MSSLLQNTVFGRNKLTYKPFISTWKTDNVSNGSSTASQIKLPLINSGNYNFIVDWGDGTTNKITAWNQSQTTHNYSLPGNYTVTITGTCVGWQFKDVGDKLKILSISKWGNLKLGTNQGLYFYGCQNLNLSTVADILDLTGTTSLQHAFTNCSTITYINRINEWNTSSVTDLSYTFYFSKFNQNIGSWDVSNVSDFSLMFYGSTLFNNGGSSDINNWSLKTTGPVTLKSMFTNASSFNQPLNNWNTSAVTAMPQMFLNAIIFNQPLKDWNTENVTNMSQMFQGANKFNQNLGSWNVSKVGSFSSMFNSAFVFNNGGSSDINNWTLKTTGTVSLSTMFQGGGGSYPMSFNQPIGNWNTIAVTDMSGMFQKTGNGLHYFNQPIGNWNTSNVVTMSSMFSQGGTDGGSFNQNIGAWDVSKVSDFSNMFLGAKPFNNGGSPDINNWAIKTTGTVNMNQMFSNVNIHNLTTFNQPIGNWNTSAVTNMSQMFGATAGSVAFNQNIGNWDVSNVTNFTNFMINKSPANFSTANLDAIYNGWSSKNLKPSLIITFGTAKSTSASSSGKAILTSAPNNWVITDGGI